MTTAGRTCPTDRGQDPSPAWGPNLAIFPETLHWDISRIGMPKSISGLCLNIPECRPAGLGPPEQSADLGSG